MTFIPEERQRPISSALFAILALGSLFLAILIVNEFRKGTYIGSEFTENNTLTVEGEGEAFAVPDVATFTVSVQDEAQTVAEAQETVTNEMNSIIEYLESSGIQERDIRTVGYNIYPRYEWHEATRDIYAPEGQRILVGYEVTHTLEVKVRDTQKAGELLSEVGSRGVDSVSGISFTVDDEDEVIREARKQAISDAKIKARELARDLGVELVRISSFSDVTPGQPIPYMKTEALDMDAGRGSDEVVIPDIPLGENKVVSRVQITYEIR